MVISSPAGRQPTARLRLRARLPVARSASSAGSTMAPPGPDAAKPIHDCAHAHGRDHGREYANGTFGALSSLKRGSGGHIAAKNSPNCYIITSKLSSRPD